MDTNFPLLRTMSLGPYSLPTIFIGFCGKVFGVQEVYDYWCSPSWTFYRQFSQLWLMIGEEITIILSFRIKWILNSIVNPRLLVSWANIYILGNKIAHVVIVEVCTWKLQILNTYWYILLQLIAGVNSSFIEFNFPDIMGLKRNS